MDVILIDDEKSMLLLTKKMLSKIEGVRLLGMFQRILDAEEFIRHNSVDIAFIDINMPEESGLDFVRRNEAILDAWHTAVVFLTAHRDYALEAFDVHAFDYIVKPVVKQRLESAIDNVRNRRGFSRLPENPPQGTELESVFEFESARVQRQYPRYKLFVNGFGGIGAKDPSGELVRFGSSKSVELFAYLLSKRGRWTSKWNILEDVFCGMLTKNAEGYLNTTVYKLRKALGAVDGSMKSCIVFTDEGYSIDVDAMYVDFFQFENCVKGYASITWENYEAALEVETLFSGELFGDKGYQWSYIERDRLLQIYVAYVKKIAAFMIDSNMAKRAISLLIKAESFQEFDEEIQLQLMQAYIALQDRLSLTRQYEKYCSRMVNELMLYPENENTNGNVSSTGYDDAVTRFYRDFVKKDG